VGHCVEIAATYFTDNLSGLTILIGMWPVWLIGPWALWLMRRESGEDLQVERSIKWPEAQGRVMDTRLVWAHVEVVYEFRVSGKIYEGLHKIHLGPVPMGGASARSARALDAAAKRNMKEFPVKSPVVVRYNPANPAESVLYCLGQIQPSAAGPKIEPHFMTFE
jgi:hypothetical protein